MIRKNDVIVVAAGLSGIVMGLAWPPLTSRLARYISYILMALLFFSFLKISADQIWRALRDNPVRLIILIAIKLIFMPLAIYYPTAWLAPDYGLAMLLLAGVSTGVVAPFFVGVIGGNMALALVMAVSTSLILPLSLPLMVQFTAGRALDFDLADMAVFLGLIIFIPLLAAGLTRRFLSRVTRMLSHASFSVSVILIFLTNTAIFGKYAGFILSEPQTLIVAFLLATFLAVLAFASGSLRLWGKLSSDRAGAAGSLTLINNVLVVVLGVHLNDALTSITAGLYMLPTFMLLVPLAWLARRDEIK